MVEIDYGMSLCFKPKIENRFGIFVVEKRQVEGFSYHSCNPVEKRQVEGFSTSTTAAATSVGFPLFGGSISETNGMNSVPFSFSGKSSAASAIAKTDSKLRNPETIPQVEPSSVIGEDHSFKSSTSGANFTVKSQNELKTSAVSPSPSREALGAAEKCYL